MPQIELGAITSIPDQIHHQILSEILTDDTPQPDFQERFILGFAEGFCAIMREFGHDGDLWNWRNIKPRLRDVSFWDAQYDSPKDEKWGMSTMDAFRCLIDHPRTITLLQGIENTVRQLRESGNHLVAIDAGTGTGILSMGLVEAGCDKVFALEINGDTAKVAAEFIKRNGYDAIEVVHCDATKEIPRLNGVQADILVSENLSTGLFDEPQAQIIQNLLKYLKPGAKIVPCAAELSVALGRSNKWDNWEMRNLSARKLDDLEIYTPFHSSIRVDLETCNRISLIEGTANVLLPHGVSINTLIIATGFQINDGPNQVYLASDAADFLGKPTAFRLPREHNFSPGVSISLRYPPGADSRFMNIDVENNNISLTGSRP